MAEPVVADVMTRQVITATPDASFKELTATMIEHQLDAVPIVDRECRLAGVVTDADLLAKVEFHGGADYPPLLAGSRSRARWRKSFSLTAGELMTTSVATVLETSSLRLAVYAMADDTVRRLYVV